MTPVGIEEHFLVVHPVAKNYNRNRASVNLLRAISCFHRGVNEVFRSPGILCRVDGCGATDVSGRRVGTTSNSQEAKKIWVVGVVSEQAETDMLSRNVV
jgi:hypothetical protein